jgi:hypothetical protein
MNILRRIAPLLTMLAVVAIGAAIAVALSGCAVQQSFWMPDPGAFGVPVMTFGVIGF